MVTLIQQILDSLQSFELLGSVVAALLTVVGGLVAVITQSRLAIEKRPREITFKQSDDLEKDSRLKEIYTARLRQESIAIWNGRAAGSLTFGQYVVAGVLASSFVQEALPQQVVGFLGVLVLVSSLVHQRFRPDIRASGSRQRSHKAGVLIRLIEDDLFALENSHPDAPSIYQIRRRASSGLTEIEESELVELENNQADTAA